MWPVLFSIGQFQLLTSSVLITIAVMLSVFAVWRKAREELFEDDLVFDAVLLSIMIAVVSGKIGSFLLSLQPSQWSDSAAIIANFFQAGFSEHIAIITGLLFFKWYVTRLKWDSDEFLEFVAPPLALFLFFQWLGRFFSGAYVGTVTALPTGLQFPGAFDQRHPVQLYFAVSFLLLWILLRYLEPRYRFFAWYRGKKQMVEPGFLLGVFLIHYGLIYFFFSWLTAANLLSEVPRFISQLFFISVSAYGLWRVYSRSRFIVRRKKTALTKKGKASRPLLWMSRLRRTLKK
jgi:prolipoprotein diacylglyceryltransferase